MERRTKCKDKIVDRTLKALFFKLGHTIGEHPLYFLLVPLLLTALCVSGFQQMDYEFDPEYLFSPTSGFAKQERALQESHFPTNYSSFKSSRITRTGKFARVIVSAKDGGSILRTQLWNQLLYLDQIIYNSTIEVDDKQLSYTDLCATYDDYCYDNEILRLSDLIPSIESKDINLTYPIFFDPYTFQSYTLPMFFGGLTLSDVNTVESVKAVGVAYFLDSADNWKEEVGNKWEKRVLDDVLELKDVYASDLEVGVFVSNTPAWEMERSRLSITHILYLNVIFMIVFGLLASMMCDSVKSKPLIGLGGLLSAALASLAGFGFCCYLGVEFISLNMAAPFLLLGIGLDDTYVLLSSWRRSDVHASVSDRMGGSFSDAAVSITVTSATNFMSFMIGAITPFPCVRIFCLYTGVSVAFIYVWHCTLFGAMLAYSGYHEAKNRHGLIPCVTVTPRSLAKERSSLYRLFMTGGINPDDPYNPEDNQEHAGMVFFRDKVGPVLDKTWVKCLVLICFLAYIAVACWGVANIREGLEKRNTANYDSYSVTFYDMDDLYFKEYGFSISVTFTSPHLDLSDSATRDKILGITSELEDTPFIDGNVTSCWLRDFLDYARRSAEFGGGIVVPMANEAEFAQSVKDYLGEPAGEQMLDMEFEVAKGGNVTRIKAARFVIQGHNIKTSKMEQHMLSDLRDICNRHSIPSGITVSVFHPWFIYIDQYLEILTQTIQCIIVTAAVMVVIALILIPSPICSFWVSFSIVSIEVGVLGYMTWWGVRLDGVALINLIMCIGFSVDFSAHICYHYITEDDKEPKDRIRGSLYALGVPILQGAGSTIIGVLGLAFAPSYLFVTFFKMIFLVILLGALHGLVLLPVLLSLFGPGACSSRFSKSSSKSTRSSGISTPTTISCNGANGASRYTVNLGYVPTEAEFTPNPMILGAGPRVGGGKGVAMGHHQSRRIHGRKHEGSSKWSIGSKTRSSRSDLAMMDCSSGGPPAVKVLCYRQNHQALPQLQQTPVGHILGGGGDGLCMSSSSRDATADTSTATSSSSSPSAPTVSANRKRTSAPKSKPSVMVEPVTTATEELTSTSSSTSTTPRMQPVAEKKKESRSRTDRNMRHRSNHDVAGIGEGRGGGGGERSKERRREGNSNGRVPSSHNHHRSHHHHHGGGGGEKKILSRSKSQIPYSNSDSGFRLSSGSEGSGNLAVTSAVAMAAAAGGISVPAPSPPQAPTLPPGVAGSGAAGNKQPFRKSHSFPYHAFSNEDSCSSDESFRSKDSNGLVAAATAAGNVRSRPNTEAEFRRRSSHHVQPQQHLAAAVVASENRSGGL